MDYSSSNLTFYGLTEDKDLCVNISIIDDNLVERDEENFTVEAVYAIGSEMSADSIIIRIKDNDGEIISMLCLCSEAIPSAIGLHFCLRNYLLMTQ